MIKNAGFTLIEVLIAMIVLAVGLLGLAMLQTTGLNNNQNSYNRSQAVQLAEDIADKMRANKLMADNYLTTFKAASAAKCATGDSPCTACSSAANSCTPAQMAVKDLYDWYSALTTALPKGKDDLMPTGTITKSGSIYTVTINWDENKDGGISAATDPNFMVRFQL